MKITLVTVGKIKEKYLEAAIAEYSKRLGRYCRLEIVQVADEKTPDKASELQDSGAYQGGRVCDCTCDRWKAAFLGGDGGMDGRSGRAR